MFKVEEVKKSFKNKEVLKGVSFSIGEGDKVALLGNNGAGKSTLLKIIAGQLAANSGKISTSLNYQTEIGMMPQGDILIDDLTVSDLVYLKSKMNQIDSINVDEFLDMVELRDFKNHYVSGLSGGQKRRLSLLLTILNSPKLIFLDEPTTGQDQKSLENLSMLLSYAAEQGKTIFFCTHDIELASSLADRIFVLAQGHFVAVGAPHEIFSNKEVLRMGGLSIPPMLELSEYLGIDPCITVKEVMRHVL